jgi:asparagine N-glycosylation enzyme membrane subunit Stt3
LPSLPLGRGLYLGKFWDRPDSDERHFGIALVATAAMLFLTAVSWQPLYQIAFAVSALALVVIAMRRLTNLHRKGTFAAG